MSYKGKGLVAVLDDRGITAYSYYNQKYGMYELSTQALQDMSLARLLEIGRNHDIETIWVTPGSMVSHQARQMYEQRAPNLKMYKSLKRDGMPRFLLMWSEEGNHKSARLAFPEHDSRWPWQHCLNSKTLLHSVLYLQDVLNCEIAWSPGHTGRELMLELNEKHPEWIAPVDALPDVIPANLALDMQWKRELASDERGDGLFFHLVDKRSMYLAACTSANLGEGEPVYLEKPKFQGRVPGIWRVGDLWRWTPYLEYVFSGLDDNDEERPDIEEAYIWPKYHQALRTWGEHMWQARQVLDSARTGMNPRYSDRQAAELAYPAVKQIANQAMGWLAMESKHLDNKLYRPDWWSMIVSTAHRNMGFKIKQLNKVGLPPVFCTVDALGFVSTGDSMEPYSRYLLDRQDQLGGFRHVATIKFSRQLQELFADEVRFSECHEGLLKAINER